MRTLPAFLLSLLALFSCGPFDYSPTLPDHGRGAPRLNLRNLERLSAHSGGPRLQGRVAVLADTHHYYDSLRDAVRSLNADTSLDFVVVAGDVTRFGYGKEYRIFSEILSGLHAPSLVVIGNHDRQADGLALYERLYGPTDFAFAWRGYQFIFFDDNARGIPEGIPDWEWLDGAMAAAGDSLRVIPVCHAPPYTDQLDSAQSARLERLYTRNRAVIIIGGHTHNYRFGEPYGDGIPYLVADDIGDRNYAVVTLSNGKAVVERVHF